MRVRPPISTTSSQLVSPGADLDRDRQPGVARCAGDAEPRSLTRPTRSSPAGPGSRARRAGARRQASGGSPKPSACYARHSRATGTRDRPSLVVRRGCRPWAARCSLGHGYTRRQLARQARGGSEDGGGSPPRAGGEGLPEPNPRTGRAQAGTRRAARDAGCRLSRSGGAQAAARPPVQRDDSEAGHRPAKLDRITIEWSSSRSRLPSSRTDYRDLAVVLRYRSCSPAVVGAALRHHRRPPTFLSILFALALDALGLSDAARSSRSACSSCWRRHLLAAVWINGTLAALARPRDLGVLLALRGYLYVLRRAHDRIGSTAPPTGGQTMGVAIASTATPATSGGRPKRRAQAPRARQRAPSLRLSSSPPPPLLSACTEDTTSFPLQAVRINKGSTGKRYARQGSSRTDARSRT